MTTTSNLNTPSARTVMIAGALACFATTAFVSSSAAAEVAAGESTCFDTGAAGPVGVVLNGTAARPQGSGFLNFYTDDAEIDPTANSSVNYDLGANIANGVVTPSNEDGRICVYNSEATDVLVDVAGFVDILALEPTVGGTARVVDTRSGFGKFDAGQTECFRPYANVDEGRAVLVNALAVAPEAKGFLNFYPKGSSAAPDANSILNFDAGKNIANGVTTTTGEDGEMCIYASQPTHIVIDLIAAVEETAYRPANADNSASRVLNTRSDDAKVASNTSVCVSTDAEPGEAVVLNGTAVNADANGFLNIYPQGAVDPAANSTINYSPGQNIANGVIVPAGTDGEICVFANEATHVVIDITGFLVPGVFTPVNADGSANRVLDTRS